MNELLYWGDDVWLRYDSPQTKFAKKNIDFISEILKFLVYFLQMICCKWTQHYIVQLNLQIQYVGPKIISSDGISISIYRV